MSGLWRGFYLTFLSYFVLAAIPAAIALPIDPSDTSGLEEINRVTDSKTGLIYSVLMHRNTGKEIEDGLPSHLRADPNFKGFWSLNRDVAAASAKSFAPDSALFLSALGLVAFRELLTNYSDNPDAMYNFVNHQMLDPLAAFSLASFTLTNRASVAYFDATLTRLGLLRNEEVYFNWLAKLKAAHPPPDISLMDAAEADSATEAYESYWQELKNATEIAMPEKAGSAAFRLIGASQGLAVASILSGYITDFASDPNVSICVGDFFKSPKQKRIWSLQHKISPRLACDLAYKKWTSSQRLVDHIPDVEAAFTAMGIQLGSKFIWNFGARRLESVIPMVIRGLKIGSPLIEQYRPVRVLTYLYYGYTFFELNKYFLSIYHESFESSRQGKGLIELYADLDRSSFSQSLPKICDETLARGKAEAEHKLSYYEKKLWLREKSLECQNLSPAYEERLDDFAKKMEAWRDIDWEPVQAKLSAWENYVSRIQSMYSSSRIFYKKWIEILNRPKHADSIFSESAPFYGIAPDGFPRLIEDSLVKSIKYVRAKIDFLKTQKIHNPLDLRSRFALYEAIRLYKRIDVYFSALDWSMPPSPHLKSRLKAIAKNISASERDAQENRIREEEFSYGILLLNQIVGDQSLDSVLAGDPEQTMRPLPLPKQWIWLSDQQIENFGFFALKKLLGEARPMLFPGEAPIAALNENAQVIETAFKDNYPKKLEQIELRSKAEYLLASFVCGPNPSKHNLWSYLTGASQATKEYFGYYANFYPPRMVNTDRDFCNESAMGESKDLFGNNLIPTDLFATKWFLDGFLPVEGFARLSEKLLRPEFKNANWDANFERYWTENVESQLKEMMKTWLSEYRDVIEKSVWPSLLAQNAATTYFEIQPASSQDPVTGMQLISVEFKKGFLASLDQEFSFYLKWLQRACRKNCGQDLARIERAQRSLEEIVKDPLSSAREVQKLNDPELANTLSVLMSMAGEGLEPLAEADMTLKAIQETTDARFLAAGGKISEAGSSDEIRAFDALAKNLVRVMAQTASLLNFYKGLEIEGLK